MQDMIPHSERNSPHDLIKFRDFFACVFGHLDTLRDYCALMHTCTVLRDIGRRQAKYAEFESFGKLLLDRSSDKSVLKIIGCRDTSHNREGLWIISFSSPSLVSIGFHVNGCPDAVLMKHDMKDGHIFKFIDRFRTRFYPSQRCKEDLIRRCKQDPLYIFLPKSQRQEIDEIIYPSVKEIHAAITEYL